MNNKSPKCFFTTHYTELFECELVDINHKNLQFLSMNVMVEEKENEVIKEITYLYKLTDGKISYSYGIETAQISGISNEILVRAKEISEKISKNEIIERVYSKNEKYENEKHYEIVEMFLSLEYDEDEDVKNFIEYIKKMNSEINKIRIQ
jgi:DNA mismatch repair protein MutS